MVGGSKSVFWQALVFTVIIFGVGLLLGYYLESSRASKVELNLLNSEVALLDEQIRGRIIEDSNVSCEVAIGSTFAFADKIYGEALALEKYDSSSKFNKEIMIVLHKRYDILRMMLWDESLKLKKRCPSFHTVIYLFEYSPENIEIKGRQGYFSNLLLDVKNNNPGKILLIPIAANLDLASIDVAMEIYGINELPSIIIDEKKVVNNIITLEEIEKMIFSKAA